MSDSMNQEMKKTLLLLLWNIGAFKVATEPGKGFRLKLHEKNPDAPLSPIYMNLRTPQNPKPGPLKSNVVELIAELFYKYIKESQLEFDFIAGIPNAADPFVRELSIMLYEGNGTEKILYMEKVSSNDQRKIACLSTDSEGELNQAPSDTNVLLIDDLITGAHSKVEAIKVLEDSHATVTDLLVLIDRQQGGKEELEKKGYRVHSIFTIKEILDMYLKEGLLDQSDYTKIVMYLKEND